MTDALPTASLIERIQHALLEALSHIPTSTCAASVNPKDEAEKLAFKAKATAAGIAFGLSIPPGPLGLLTIIPDLIAIWKIQAQLVADIAALYGKTAVLSREAMIYCLFKHGVASLGRDLLVRVGKRVLLRRASLRVIQRLLAQVGIKVASRAVGKVIVRGAPIIGGGVVAVYAWYDTGGVAKNAINLFSKVDAVRRARSTATANKKTASKPSRSTHGAVRLRQGKGRAVRPQPGTGRPRQRK